MACEECDSVCRRRTILSSAWHCTAAGWKGLVERLFQRGLIKVVFATETLAAGINMPARTTVISALARRRGDELKVRLCSTARADT